MRVLMHLKGTTALVMHNPRMADPLDPIVKEKKTLTAKRTNKTEEDLENIARLEFLGALYYDKAVGVYIPTANVLTCLRNAARETKDGKKLVQALSPHVDIVPLQFKGPRTPTALYEEERFRWRATVAMKGQRVVKVRPRFFPPWSLEIEWELDTEKVDFERLVFIAEKAGKTEGLGEARTLGYGRFTVEVLGDQPATSTVK